MRRFAWLLALLVGIAAGQARAATFNFVTSIDDVQELSCGFVSTARGSGTATLNDATGLLSWSFTFGTNGPGYTNALLGNGAESGAHIHGPAAVGVGGAGVQVALSAGSPKVASATLSAGQMTDLKNGLYYVNIHSTGCPGGEIRGQLLAAPAASTLPVPLSLALCGLLALAIALALRTDRKAA